MSLEAFGDEGPEVISADDLLAHGWECDPDCEKWWRAGEPEETFTFERAAEIEEDRSWSED